MPDLTNALTNALTNDLTNDLTWLRQIIQSELADVLAEESIGHAACNTPDRLHLRADNVATYILRRLTSQPGVYGDLATERARQDAQWGGPDHDDSHSPRDWRDYREKFEGRAEARHGAARRDALVKIAALAVAQIESHDRKVRRDREFAGLGPV